MMGILFFMFTFSFVFLCRNNFREVEVLGLANLLRFNVAMKSNNDLVVMFNKRHDNLMKKIIIRKYFSFYKEPEYDHKTKVCI